VTSSDKSTPREIAVNVLIKWQSFNKDKRPPLNELMQEDIPAFFSSKDRGFLMEIVFGVIRRYDYLLFILSQKTKKNQKIQPVIKSTLLIAIYEILFMDTPDYASINEAVNNIKKKEKWAAGFVNAVLRTITREKDLLSPETIDLTGLDNIKSLALKTSHPLWMVKRWAQRFGFDKTERLCHTNNTHAPFTLRVNTLKTIRDNLIEQFTIAGIQAQKGMLAKESIIINDFHGAPKDLPFFNEGFFQVQDEASQLVTIIAEPKENEKILDMCAGLGGKTTHIAQLTRDLAEIDATDTSKKRLDKLLENTARLGIKSIKTIYFQEFNGLKDNRGDYYDCIIIDAPCSGLGTIRRHPDIKWNRDEKIINSLADIQLDLLNNAVNMVKQGGRIVYSVCSFETEETTDVIKKFLDKNTDWKIKPVKMERITDYCEDNQGVITLITEENGHDGFFVGALERFK